MFRILSIALVAAVCYLGTAPTDLDARCGDGNGVFSKLLHPFKTISDNHQARVESRQAQRSSAYARTAPPITNVYRIPQALPQGPGACPCPNCPGNPMGQPQAGPPAKKVDDFTTPIPGYVPPMNGVAPPAKKASRLTNDGSYYPPGYVQASATVRRASSTSNCPGGVCPTR